MTTAGTTEVAEPMKPGVGRYLMTVRIGDYPNSRALLDDLIGHGREVSCLTAMALKSIPISLEKKELDLWVVRADELESSLGDACLLSDFYDLSLRHGLELCPPEVVPLLSLHGNGLPPVFVATPLKMTNKFIIKGEELTGYPMNSLNFPLDTGEVIGVFVKPRSN